MKRRSRACEACQKLKAKCDPLPSGHCERCDRAGIECVPAASRFQRDRIAELEAQVDELTRRRVTANPTHESLIAFIDARIEPDMQRQVLATFASHNAAVWPVLSATDMDLDNLRETSPHLLLAILAFPGDTRLPVQLHEGLILKAMSGFGDEIIAKGNRSLQMVKALLMAAFWFRQARNVAHGHCYQLVQLAVDMAIDIGIAGPQLTRPPPAYFSETDNPTSPDARRTWIACFLAAAAQSLCVRRPPSVSWTPYLEESIGRLDKTDGLLVQIARIMGICSDAAGQLSLCDLALYKGVEDVRDQMTALRGRVSAWYAELPANLASDPVLSFWREVALVHIHEIVLHTRTNKGLFSGPYVPDKIAVTDFAAPDELSPEVAQTLQYLLHACHSAIRQFAVMSPSVILGVSSLVIGPAVLHAHFVLAQAHVAVTGLGNRLGEISSPEDVALATNMRELEDVAQVLDSLDPCQSSFTTTALQSSRWLRTWLNDYDAIVRRYRANLTRERGLGESCRDA